MDPYDLLDAPVNRILLALSPSTDHDSYHHTRSYRPQTPYISQGPEHRFSGQTSRLACVGLFTPIDSEFYRHANAGLRPTHAILGRKLIFSASDLRIWKRTFIIFIRIGRHLHLLRLHTCLASPLRPGPIFLGRWSLWEPREQPARWWFI